MFEGRMPRLPPFRVCSISNTRVAKADTSWSCRQMTTSYNLQIIRYLQYISGMATMAAKVQTAESERNRNAFTD